MKRALTAESFRGQHISAQLTITNPAPVLRTTKTAQPTIHATYTDSANRQINANQPHAKVMLDKLVATSPYAVPFEELVSTVAAYVSANNLQIDAPAYVSSELAVLLGQGVATLYGAPMTRPSPESARIFNYSRWHAARGNVVTNALHGLVQLTPEQHALMKADCAPDTARVQELIDLGVMI